MPHEKKGCIFIVDDEEKWRKFIKAVLEEDDYQVITAADYNTAITLLKNNDFDVAILDVRLIDAQQYNVQGMELLKKMKDMNPTTSAIILTGYPDQSHKEKAVNVYKADAYIEKGSSFNVDEFSQLIRNLLIQKHLSDSEQT